MDGEQSAGELIGNSGAGTDQENIGSGRAEKGDQKPCKSLYRHSHWFLYLREY
jgi:hypothetical protein